MCAGRWQLGCPPGGQTPSCAFLPPPAQRSFSGCVGHLAQVPTLPVGFCQLAGGPATRRMARPGSVGPQRSHSLQWPGAVSVLVLCPCTTAMCASVVWLGLPSCLSMRKASLYLALLQGLLPSAVIQFWQHHCVSQTVCCCPSSWPVLVCLELDISSLRALTQLGLSQ